MTSRLDDAPTDLALLRAEIETLDGELLDLLARRLRVVERVAKAKLVTASPLRDHLREEHVLARVRHAAASRGIAPRDAERWFRTLLDLSVAHQAGFIRDLPSAPLRIAYQGVEGSYSHLAAQARYAGRPGGALLTGYAELDQATAALFRGDADVALLPIENSTAGSIDRTYDLLAKEPLTILAEVIRPVSHCLLALPGVALEELRIVLSHPQAIAQCEAFLTRSPWLKAQAEFDTAGSARKVREAQDRRLAAIASEHAGAVYGLAVVARGIQNEEGNATRFIEVGLEAPPLPHDRPAKTSLLMIVDHQPGSLSAVLACFGQRGVNLEKLESRPIPAEPWRYRFYIDVAGHAADEPLAGALAAVSAFTRELKVLGSYPKDEGPTAQ